MEEHVLIAFSPFTIFTTYAGHGIREDANQNDIR